MRIHSPDEGPSLSRAFNSWAISMISIHSKITEMRLLFIETYFLRATYMRIVRYWKLEVAGGRLAKVWGTHDQTCPCIIGTIWEWKGDGQGHSTFDWPCHQLEIHRWRTDFYSAWFIPSIWKLVKSGGSSSQNARHQTFWEWRSFLIYSLKLARTTPIFGTVKAKTIGTWLRDYNQGDLPEMLEQGLRCHDPQQESDFTTTTVSDGGITETTSSHEARKGSCMGCAIPPFSLYVMFARLDAWIYHADLASTERKE